MRASLCSECSNIGVVVVGNLVDDSAFVQIEKRATTFQREAQDVCSRVTEDFIQCMDTSCTGFPPVIVKEIVCRILSVQIVGGLTRTLFTDVHRTSV